MGVFVIWIWDVLHAAPRTRLATRRRSRTNLRGLTTPRKKRPGRRPYSGLLQVVAELLRARRVAELAQRLGLDLADPLAGHAEPLADLFQRALVTVDQPEPQLQHAPLPRSQSIEHVLHLGVQHRQRSGVRRRDGLAVLRSE